MHRNRGHIYSSRGRAGKRASDIVESLQKATFPELSPEELLSLATAHHNRAKSKFFLMDGIGLSTTPEDALKIADRSLPDTTFEGSGYERETYVGVLRRVCVNYLRHIETPYDKFAFEAKRRGDDDAFVKAKRNLLERIAGKYGFLAETCRRLDERTKETVRRRSESDVLRNARKNMDGDVVSSYFTSCLETNEKAI